MLDIIFAAKDIVYLLMCNVNVPNAVWQVHKGLGYLCSRVECRPGSGTIIEICYGYNKSVRVIRAVQ